MKETELHAPLKYFLEKRGYSVNFEVKNCDIVARKKDELVVIEMKTRMSLTLLAQANARKELTESVYIAVPFYPGGKGIQNFRNLKKLLRKLELGLIAVFVMKRKTRVEILMHPAPYKERKSKKKIFALINEINGRSAEMNISGSSGRTAKMTAYRLEAIKIASMLEKMGESSPRKLREKGCFEKTQRVLHDNYYGWFDRRERAVYLINDCGRKALEEYRKLLNEKNR